MIPQIGPGAVSAESDYYLHKTVMRALSELEPCFFYVWLKSRHEGAMEPEDDKLFLYEDVDLSFYNQMAVSGGRLIELFHRQHGVYPVDVVFTSRAALAGTLAIGLADRSGKAVPTAITEPHVYAMFEHSHNKVTYIDSVVRGAGYAVGAGIYWSKYERDAALNCASLFLSSAAVKAMEENSFVVDALVDVPEYKRVEPEGMKRLIFAGRLNVNKRWRDILDSYGKVLMQRKDIEVWVHSGVGAVKKLDPADSRWHRISEKYSYDDYIKLLSESHVGAYWSLDEGMNISVLEMLMAGIVMVLPNRPWVHKLFDPLEYPYIAKNKAEMASMLDYMLDHYLECWQKLAEVRQLIIKRNGWPTFKANFKDVYDWLKSLEQETPYRKFRDVTMDILNKKGEESFRVIDMATRAWRHYPPSIIPLSSMYQCYLSVRDLDDMKSAIPVLRLKEDA